jgi:branched-chain amino acid transport system permease protein
VWVHAIGNAVGSPALAQADIPKYNFLLFGLLLVLMMLLRPEGIIPNRQRAEELHSGEGGDVGDALGGTARG